MNPLPDGAVRCVHEIYPDSHQKPPKASTHPKSPERKPAGRPAQGPEVLILRGEYVVILFGISFRCRLASSGSIIVQYIWYHTAVQIR